jgi:hypothetical protein
MLKLLTLSLALASVASALESFPLTEEDFALAKTLDLQEMARTRSFEGGPITPPKGHAKEDVVPKGVRPNHFWRPLNNLPARLSL